MKSWKASHYVMSLNVPVVLTRWKCNFAMNSVQYIHYNYFWLLAAFWQQYLNGTFFSRRDRHWNFRLSLYLIKSTKFLQSGALIASSFFFTIKMTYKGDQHVWTYMCNEPNQRTRSILLTIQWQSNQNFFELMNPKVFLSVASRIDDPSICFYTWNWN